MSTYDFVHLVFHAAGDQIYGRTKLQKMVYFVGAITGSLQQLGYRAHYYGPYSSEVSAAVDELRGLGFLSQQVASVGSRDSQGFEVTRYDYMLTNEGKLVAQEKAEKNPTLWNKISQAVQKLLQAKAEDYVKLSIAAKSYFMRTQGEASSSSIERSRQTSQFGWVVSPEQFDEADQLLSEIDLLPKPVSK